MAQQDDIIIIKEIESMTTSILDYFLNIALVTEITEEDLISDTTFSSSGMETYDSLDAVAENFKTTSKIYSIARDIFNQKTNTGVNQSNIKRLVILKKEDSDANFEACLTRLGYKNSYYIVPNAKTDQDIDYVNNWVGTQRKLQFAQTESSDVLEDGTDDIASTLYAKNAKRTALYYHGTADESLAGAIASILASYPVGGKGASYKKPTNITVDTLTSTQETNLENKNVNSYVPFIGGAGDYSTRYLTSTNGVTLSGDEIEKIIAVDRIVLSVQAALMDALEEDIPYDDAGGTIVYNKINGVLSSLKNEGVLAQDSTNDETGEVDKSYSIKVYTRAYVKANYPDYFKQKMFLVDVTVNLAGSGKKVMITLAY